MIFSSYQCIVTRSNTILCKLYFLEQMYRDKQTRGGQTQRSRWFTIIAIAAIACVLFVLYNHQQSRANSVLSGAYYLVFVQKRTVKVAAVYYIFTIHIWRKINRLVKLIDFLKTVSILLDSSFINSHTFYRSTIAYF